jgi:putrescine---pyruvate transaminase
MSWGWEDDVMTSSALLHPFADPAKPEGDFVKIVRAEGTTLWDDTGKTYLDAMASLWFCQIGHGNREMVDAIGTQLAQLDSHHIFDPFTHQPAIDAAEAIRSVSPMPDGRVFLGSSGSEAVDTALKLMRQFHRLNGDPDRQVLLRRTRGYHGTNWGGTTAQGIEPNRDGWGDLVPHFVEIDPDDIEDAARVFAEHGDRIAGVITEPIQGAGGVFPPSDGYLEGLRRLTEQHGALLCFDEVISGFGRTGSWFASQTYGVTPDLITFAKGVTSGYQPLSGVVVGRRVADAFESSDAMLRTGYTYSGHPAACAAGVTNIAIIERDGLVARATEIGERFEAAFAALTRDGVIAGHRGTGAVQAALLHADGIGTRRRMLEGGVVVRPIGEALAFCPPLTSTDAEIDTMIDVMVASIHPA